MIFSNGLDDKVRDGSKTQTRRLVKENDYASRMWRDPVTLIPDDALYKLISRVKRRGRIKWVVGPTYAIQSGRGKKGNGRFRIVKIRKENVQDISIIDCYAEGVVEVVGHWDESSGNVNVREHFGKMWDSIHKKPGDRWEDNPEVWVLEFELVGGADG